VKKGFLRLAVRQNTAPMSASMHLAADCKERGFGMKMDTGFYTLATGTASRNILRLWKIL
jgi:hypothetical protein